MKRLLLQSPSKLPQFYVRIFCAILLLLGFSHASNAQCNFYEHYDSGFVDIATLTAAGYTNNGFVASTSTVAQGTTTNSPRTGTYSLNSTTAGVAGNYVQTPSVSAPDVFGFYMRRGAGSSAFIDIKVNDGTHGWVSLRNATALANYGITTYSANILTPATQLTTSWAQYYIQFDGTPAAGYTNTNLQFQIVDNRGAGFSGTMWLDDIFWTSKTTGNNLKIVPSLGTSSCSSSLATGSVYTLYDVGGEYDYYNFSQNNTLAFSPATAGDKIEITFVSYNTNADPLDYITVNDGTSNVVSNYTGTGNPTTVTYTAAANATMTIQFISDATTATIKDGFTITVKCISGSTCSLPGTLNAATSITATGATISWTAAAGPPAGYDIFYSTNSGATPSVMTTSVGATKSLTGLTSNTTYYYWVRSNCGGTQSAWVGPSAAFTTLCAAVAPPYTENFNGQPTSALPTCTSADNAGWQVNTTNGYLTNNIVSTNFFTRALQLTGNTTYRLSYDYGSALGDLTLKVYYGTTTQTPTSTNIAVLLNTHPGVTGLNTNIGTFTTPAFGGVYYIRFELVSTSAAPSTTLILDNINVIQETCGPGRTLTASGVTFQAATVSWLVPAAPFSPPANGYQYFLSTSSTTPTYNDTPTGTTAAGVTTVNLSGLASSTTYYIWVRSNCSGYFSTWSVPTSFTTAAGSTPLILDATSNGTIKTACDYSFFDSGGSSGDYQNNETYTVTVKPVVATEKVKVVFSTFATENRYDGLSIYNGNSTGAPLINSGLPVGNNATTCPAGSYYGTTSPGTIISSAADGSLTFKFTTDFSVLAAGWSAFISCVVPPVITSFDFPDNNCGSRTQVIITGTNFSGATNVSFNGVSAAFSVNSSTQITATIPAGATSGPISVSNANATGYSSTSYLINSAPPVTTGVTICAGGTGTISSSTVCAGFVPSGTSIAGTLTAATDPQAPRVSPPGGNSTTCSFATYVRNYQAIQFQVSVTGTYTFAMASPYDAMGYITAGAFTPGSCATGTYIVGDDDSNGGLQPRMSATLSAGTTYTIYTTTWGLSNGTASGAYTWTVTPASGGQIMFAGNPDIQWYTAASGGSAIGSGTPFNPVGVAGSGLANTNTAGTYTYYAACSSNSTCRTATTFVINARPTVTFTAQPGATACANVNVTYTTQAGQTNYVWTVPGVAGTDYTIISGGIGTSSNTVTLQWLTTGAKVVSINYTNASGCAASSATNSTSTTVSASGFAVNVTPSTPSICANVPQSLVASSATANYYTWTTTAGALFTDAACTVPYVALTNFATVYFKGNTNATVTVNGTVGGSGCPTVVTVPVSVNVATWNGSVWSNAGVGPSNTISADFQGNFTSSVNAAATTGNLSACSVIVTSGNVLFDRGTLTVQNTVAVNAGSLVFDDATYDVSLYQPNSATNGAGVYNGGNTGNISFKRTAAPMFRYDYTYWSTPVYPQNLLAVSPNSPYFLEYNNAWAYNTTAGSTTMTPAKGYGIRAPISYNLSPGTALAYQAPFAGVPNNGDISIAIIGGAGQMNFLGNPYPSALFADDFIIANPNVNGTLYFWTHTTQSTSPYQYNSSDYAAYTLAGGTGTSAQTSVPFPGGAGNNSVPNGYIASGQGFFVKGLSNSTAVYNNSMRRAGNNKNFFRTSNDLEKNRYWLNLLSTEGAFKQALVGYIETATQGIDRLFDGELVEAGNPVSLYTKTDNMNLSIQGRALPFEISDTVPLAYRTASATTFTISIPQVDGLFNSQHVYLEDHMLNVIHDLTDSAYVFATEAGTFEDRFTLRYTDATLGIDNPIFNENTVVVYRNEVGLNINTGAEMMENVTIFDITGRLIASKKAVNNNVTVFTNLPETRQVLLVKIEGESGKTVTKKVIY